ncbi:MAG: type II secretion system minor pseudopilin GspH [Gammaproteobacteria bacterium]|jgi:general secretion pathway protein H|nr:type II secretion system minor pseudopilin GspH [Gammaproteobacteria bacterium]
MIRRQRGFTLIELMTVVFIIGVILTFATISVGQHSDQTLEEEAKRLHYLIKLASEESVLRSTSMAMEFTKQGYQFVQIAGDQFVPLEDDKLFRKREFPGDMEIQMELYGQAVSFDDEERVPRIYILSSGEMTEFKISLRMVDTQPYTITGNIIGQTKLIAPGADSNAFGT